MGRWKLKDSFLRVSFSSALEDMRFSLHLKSFSAMKEDIVFHQIPANPFSQAGSLADKVSLKPHFRQLTYILCYRAGHKALRNYHGLEK